MLKLIRRGALAACLAVAMSPAHAAAPAPAAVDLVFYTPYLKQAPDGSVINYSYVRKADDAQIEQSFEDAVKIRVAPTGAQNSVSIDMFTGARARTIDNQSRTGNPLITAVLDRNVKEMSKLLGGSFFYLQNRIMDAMRSGEGVEAQKIDYAGKSVDAWKVTLRPFAKDSHRAQLRDFADITYEMTFSDAVPGGLYALKITAPRAGEGKKPIVEENLTLVSENAAAKPTEAKQP